MNLVFDPVWPWSNLGALLGATGSGTFRVALLLAGLGVVLPMAWVLLRARFPGRWVGRLLLLAPLPILAWLVWRIGTGGALDVARLGLSGALAQLAGLLLLLVVPPVLVGLSLAAYLSSPGVSRVRRAAVVVLRLLAFALAFLAILRPSVALIAENQQRRQVFICLDHSRSMSVRDESRSPVQKGGGLPVAEKDAVSRWELVTHLLGGWVQAAERLEDRHVDVRWFKFAGGLSDLDPLHPGEADGQRTDYGALLRELADRRDPSRRPLAVLIVGDGADHGDSPALAELGRWRVPPCPVVPFAVGDPRTTAKHNDLSITAISTEPTPFVPVKSRLRVKLTVDARGYEGRQVRFRLFVERPQKGPDGKTTVEEREEPAREVALPLTTGNPVELTCEAPDQPGEYKVRVAAEAGDRDAFPHNDRAETFITVSREGIRVLLLDRLRTFEPQQICQALTEDPRIRVTPVWLGGEGAARPGAAERLLRFDEEPPDVVVVGDVTPAQVRGLDPKALDRIADLVGRGTGLMMLGGYFSLGNSDWKATPLEPLLPVDLAVGGQVDHEVRMKPTADGLRRTPSLFRLDEGDPLALWAKLPPLAGMARMQLRNPRRGIETVLAESERGEPMLVMQEAGKAKATGTTAAPARVLAFAGDSTWQWVTDPPSQKLHGRFWRQVVVWLARQEDARGGVWIKPDVRRLAARGELGFQVGTRGKGGADLAGGTYAVEVTGPAGTKTKVPVSRGASEGRGVFAGTAEPGVYQITVQGEAREPGGEVVRGESSARFTVYDQDLELAQPAADLEFLAKLARAGGAPGGELRRVQDVQAYLERLADQPRDATGTKLTLRPNWRGTGPSGFLGGFFVLFVAVVSGEWFLRRRWGMV